MVDADRVKRKLPSLLVDDCSNRHKEAWAKSMRTRRQLSNFKKHNPEKFDTLTNKLIANLSELERAVSS